MLTTVTSINFKKRNWEDQVPFSLSQDPDINDIQMIYFPKWHIAGTISKYIFLKGAKLNLFLQVTVFKIANWEVHLTASQSLKLKEARHSIDIIVGTFLMIPDWMLLLCGLYNHTEPGAHELTGAPQTADSLRSPSCAHQDQIHCIGLHLAAPNTAFKTPPFFPW